MTADIRFVCVFGFLLLLLGAYIIIQGPSEKSFVLWGELHLAPFSRTGKMPVPQEIHSLWNRHLPVHKKLIEGAHLR